MAKYQIDETDQKILSALVKNARTPFLEIARDCGVSGAAIHQRFKKMESLGIITGSRLLVKPSTLGLDVCAFVEVNLSPVNKYPEVIDALRKIPEVVECHFVTGRHTLLLKMYCFNHDHLLDILHQTSSDSCQQIIETMTDEVERHRDGAAPNDDLTMLCLKLQ